MGQGRYTVADIEKMLRHCAPEASVVQRGHRYWALRGKLRYTRLPKGKGPAGEPKSKVLVEDGHIRSLVRDLKITAECAAEHLPMVWR